MSREKFRNYVPKINSASLFFETTTAIGNSCYGITYSTKAIRLIGYFTVVYLVAKPLIWSEAEVDHVVIETSI